MRIYASLKNFIDQRPLAFWVRFCAVVIVGAVALALLTSCKGVSVGGPPANACSFHSSAYAVKKGSKWQCYTSKKVNGVNTLTRQKSWEKK